MSNLSDEKDVFPSSDDLVLVCKEHVEEVVIPILEELSQLAFEAAEKSETRFFFTIKLPQYHSRFIWKDCIEKLLIEKGFKIKRLSDANDCDTWVKLLIMW